jgi:hypothetical protein
MTKARTREQLFTALGVGLFLAGTLAGFLAFQRGGVDFLSFRLMADGVVRGIDVYDASAREVLCRGYGFVSPVGMFYPPATGFILAPLALPSYGVAKAIWFSITIAMILLGVRALVRVTVPEARERLWMGLAGLILMSSSLRWGLMLLQGAPFMLGLLCFFVASLHTKDSRWPVVIAVVATAFKMTLALPFLGLLLLRRRFVGLALCIGVSVLLNTVGFLRMGATAFGNYQHDVASLDALGENINTPDPWMAFALPRLDWVFLLYGFTKSLAVARIVTLLCSAGVAVWLLREGLRSRAPESLAASAVFLAPLVCLGSLCVYHHQYDVCLFFVPVLVGYYALDRRRQPGWAVLFVLPLLAMMSALPIGRAERVIEPLFGALGIALLKIAFPVALTLALVGSLGILRRHTARRATDPAGAQVSPS